MAGTLNTNGATISNTVEAFELYDVIRYSAGKPDETVNLKVTNGGTLDLAQELGDTPVVITGSGLGNVITTGSGNDRLYGGAKDNVLSSGDGDDLIWTGAGSNRAYGGDGNDTFDGNNGRSTFYGGSGNDHFVIEGSSSNTAVPATIYGGAGKDLIETNLRDVSIDGGSGIDTLVKDFLTPDMIIENVEVLVVAGEAKLTLAQIASFDEIRAHIDPVKAEHYYVHLVLADGGMIDLSDQLDDRPANLYLSNKGNNVVAGESSDQIHGAEGSDSIKAGNGNDHVLTGNGIKNTALGQGGNDSLYGGYGADLLNGGSGEDRLSGDNGDDTLIGGTGFNSLMGGSGKDVFVFNTAPSSASLQLISDFKSDVDTIKIDNAIFVGLAEGGLPGTAFASNNSGVATDKSDRFIYEKDTGSLFYDKDGTGSSPGILVAHLDWHPALTSEDFLVY